MFDSFPRPAFSIALVVIALSSAAFALSSAPVDSSTLRWDGTVSMGNVLAMISFVATVLTAWTNLSRDTKEIKKTGLRHETLSEEQNKRLGKIDVAIATLSTQQENLDNRMDNLEGAINARRAGHH